ncbi:Uncharacterized membrane protein YoaT, DUF817 family [Rhodospira trueperi]|uniref:Uncharacterized membrane protein YoaT, DUF817 family n=2 Tax=Rhodospira trueperi TaxID=69960 RepID=A0A1G6XST2_9PROT|nr:Uncharacterized membrane protein YoaT, DUF817 family [Rhodospira trueperi]
MSPPQTAPGRSQSRTTDGIALAFPHIGATQRRSDMADPSTPKPLDGRRLTPERWLHGLRARGARFADRHGRIGRATYEFVVFGVKQGWACLFGGLMCAGLIGSHLFYPEESALARYDFLVLYAVAIQAAMLVFRLESVAEAKIILVYHIVGTVMEVFKTHMGSWIYPEPSILRLGGVPLFSGFMYAAVGSYIARVWRLFDFRFAAYPPQALTMALAGAIYANFFGHHYLPDMRVLLFGMAGVLFWRTSVLFRIDRVHRSMPLLLGFLLVAVFIWFAENIGTYARAWVYPDQEDGWRMVSIAKLGSWYLLMMLSFVLVSLINPVRGPGQIGDS